MSAVLRCYIYTTFFKCIGIPFARPNGIKDRCKTGFTCQGGGADPVPCEEGTYANTAGSVTCVNCPPGTFSGNKGASDCEPCVVGQYRQSKKDDNITPTDATKCIGCPAGWLSEAGSTKCQSCEAGSYSNETGKECVACDAGQYRQSKKEDCIKVLVPIF